MIRFYRLFKGEVQSGSYVMAPNGEPYIVYANADGSGMTARPFSESKWYIGPLKKRLPTPVTTRKEAVEAIGFDWHRGRPMQYTGEMSKPTKKKRMPDPNVTAFLFVQKLTGQPPKAEAEEKPKAEQKPILVVRKNDKVG